MKKVFLIVFYPLVKLASIIQWDFIKSKKLSPKQLKKIAWLLIDNNYYIILTRKNTHLSTYLVSLSHWILTGRKGFYSHVLMNCEGELKLEIDESIQTLQNRFLFCEATGKGVGFSNFKEVFNCNSVCILKAKGYSSGQFTKAIDTLLSDIGKKYDTLFDLKNAKKLSCVELVRRALKSLPEYHIKMQNFEQSIKTYKDLTPDMFRESPDFEVVLEIKNN